MLNELIVQMNDVLDQWRDQYCVLEPLAGAFVVGKDNTVSMNDIVLPRFCALPLKYVRLDVQSILFYFDTGYVLRILIDWPEDQGPVISSVYSGRI